MYLVLSSSFLYKPQTAQLKSGLAFAKMADCVNAKGDGMQ
jgi:hypothetical protein